MIKEGFSRFGCVLADSAMRLQGCRSLCSRASNLNGGLQAQSWGCESKIGVSYLYEGRRKKVQAARIVNVLKRMSSWYLTPLISKEVFCKEKVLDRMIWK